MCITLQDQPLVTYGGVILGMGQGVGWGEYPLPPPLLNEILPIGSGGYGTYLHKTFVSRWTPTVRRLLDQQGRDHLGEGVGGGREERG